MDSHTADNSTPPCTGPGCCGPSRREFLRTVGLGAAAGLCAEAAAVAGPFEAKDFDRLVPADKKLRADWLRSLTERGVPTVYRGAELDKIGMPIGGLCTGQLYLGGDGKLWHWDLFNLPQAPEISDYRGPDYARPPVPASPLEQGFALRVTTSSRKPELRTLDRRCFPEIPFQGEYPVGRVTYRHQDLPVEIGLEAFSPFIPLDAEDSSLPATILHFTVKNTGTEPVDVALAGWLENAVCLASARPDAGRRRNRILREPGLVLLQATAEATPKPVRRRKRPDILFEDFEKGTYEGWRVEGTAFGNGPVRRADVPAYQGDLGGRGERVVNSHAGAPAKDVGARDAHTGKLTSRVFSIERDFINFFIGGGRQPGKTCMNLVVDGQVARTATGRDANHMHQESFDVRGLQGRRAVLEIVDAATGPWGNIGIDHIVFSDTPAVPVVLEEQPDYGSLGLALLGEAAGTFASAAVPVERPAEALLAATRHSGDEAAEPFGHRLCGGLGRSWSLKPGETASADFVLTWYFPVLPRGRFDRLVDAAKLRRSYATRFDSAAAVARYVAGKFDTLAGQTRLWNRTWYDSTLPHWFLDRTFLTVCAVASATAYHFTNGRFYGFEGTYCCEGTCTHVWQYAHGLARIFPSLERDTRERVDYGIAFHADTGAMDYRAEYDRRVAHDGQAGTILRAYREHQTAVDDQYLRRTWPRIKKSIEYLLHQDTDRDGILDGEQYNTLDASWYGQIPWISSLYLACLRAGAAMAREVNDPEFARQCEAVAERGGRRLVQHLFNGEYLIQIPDSRHAEAINSNTGCHIDQVFGQSWAFQVGLPRVLPEKETKAALESLWRYNFTPDVGVYRRGFTAIPGGRWYALPGEGGLLMCTWPHGGAEHAAGRGGNPVFVGYFNECMTGFEYQVAAHLIWEGLVEKGLAITRMIHDRYHAAHRNPWNEIECADHYARSMASYGVFLAACGFEYHGPKGHLGFAPRLTPEDFRAAFTAAEGWGTLAQRRRPGVQEQTVTVHWGHLRLRSLAFELAPGHRPARVRVEEGGERLAAEHRLEDRRLSIILARELTIPTGGSLGVRIE
jgi:uncharacterized protein (DUF608 family)